MLAKIMSEISAKKGSAYFPDDELAAGRFDALVAELGGDEAVTPQQTILICDLVRNEQLKGKLWKDIQERGVEVRYSNGRQTLKRDNKSISMMQKVQDQSRRTMMALGLIAREKPQAADDDGDDDDGFGDF